MKSDKNTAVISVIGKDRVGIIAGVSALLSENNININDSTYVLFIHII